jgi:hypothetical protein
MRLAILLCLGSRLVFAGTWAGRLVDSGCWAAEERNVNPQDTLIFVDRDRNEEIRYCSPGAKTRSFSIVTPDGLSYTLDSAGNAKAAELVRSSGKTSRLPVSVTGELNKNTIRVDSISNAH